MATATRTSMTGYHCFTRLVTTPTGREPGVEVFDDVLEDAHVELIDDLLADARGGDELRLAQDGEVPRHGRPGGIEVLGDLAEVPRPVAQQPQDIAARRIGEGAEGGIHCFLS